MQIKCDVTCSHINVTKVMDIFVKTMDKFFSILVLCFHSMKFEEPFKYLRGKFSLT